MRNTFLQILLIFSSFEGYRLQFPIPRAYFVYKLTVWHCTGHHFSSLYACIRIVCLPVRGAPGACYYEDNFSSSNVVSRAFFALCTYSRFGHHPHPTGYLYASFFRGLRCWTSPWRKIAYSINHSFTQLIWCPGNQIIKPRYQQLQYLKSS